MTIFQLLLSILAVLLVMVLPGYALALLLPERWNGMEKDIREPEVSESPKNRKGLKNPKAAKDVKELEERQDFPDPFSPWIDRVALSVAVSALLGLWLMVAGIRLGGLAVMGIYAACGLWVAFFYLRKGFRPLAIQRVSGRNIGIGLAGLLFFLVVTAWRLYQSRDLLLPAWVDPVHHSLVVRAILEQGGIPLTLQPYLDVPFYYHYGFHLITALFSFCSKLSPVQSTLWFGQVINAGVTLSVYRLGMALAVSGETASNPQGRINAHLRAIIAAVLVSFVFQMPAYYLTWGRYTLLTGLLLTGPAMAAAYEFWKNPRYYAAGVRFGVLTAGIFVTHYLAAILVGLFVGIIGIAGLLEAVKKREIQFLPWRLALVGLLAVALAAPWIARVYHYNTDTAEVRVVLPSENAPSITTTTPEYINYLVYLLGPRHNYILMGLAVVGLLLSLRSAALRPLAAWAALLMFLSQPWSVRFGPFRPDLYIIVLFFPAVLLLADLLVLVSDLLGRVWRPGAGRIGLAALTAGLLVWGIWETRDVINQSTVFVTPGDVAALNWVEANTPQDARFYINNVPWQSSIYRGVDGGFWLLPFTGRASLVPTVAYGWGSSETIQATSDLAKRTQKIFTCTPEFYDLVRDAHLTYVYVREGVGNLQPKALQNCLRLRPQYAAQGVYIYEILSP